MHSAKSIFKWEIEFKTLLVTDYVVQYEVKKEKHNYVRNVATTYMLVKVSIWFKMTSEKIF